MIIYCLYNTITEKVYVGQTSTGSEIRWQQHVRDSRRSQRNHLPLYRAIRKYGFGAFDLQELGYAYTQSAIDDLEKLWIVLLRARDDKYGYNLREGGSRGKHSDETKAKLSAAKMGKPAWNRGLKFSDESRAKMSASHKGNNSCLGRVLSDETKAKIGAKSVGRKHSAEFKVAMSERVKKFRAEKFWRSREKK